MERLINCWQEIEGGWGGGVLVRFSLCIGFGFFFFSKHLLDISCELSTLCGPLFSFFSLLLHYLLSRQSSLYVAAKMCILFRMWDLAVFRMLGWVG